MDNIKLSDLIVIDTPQKALDEVMLILGNMSSVAVPLDSVIAAFTIVVDMFEGRYPGYKACNTEYHDLRHTMDVFLAMARLIHGAYLSEINFSDREIAMGLVSALHHDTGFIQTDNDEDGTGAKYIAEHVLRSMNFFEISGQNLGFDKEAIEACQNMILCTDMSWKIEEISFSDPKHLLLGQMLGAADLMGQMADRSYLEKLLFLYREYKETNFGGYSDELDLLRKTLNFYEYVFDRMQKHLGSTDRFMKKHFVARWNVNHDLYKKSIVNQREYLRKIFAEAQTDPRSQLKRRKKITLSKESYGDTTAPSNS